MFITEKYKYITPRVALIDMDGTLYDSMPRHARAWHRMASEIGIDCSVEEFFAYEGRTGASTINLLFQRSFGRDANAEEIKELYGRKSKYFVEQSEAPIMPGAPEMLQTLLRNDIRPVLVTGSGQQSLLTKLNRDFPGVFSEAMRVTAHDVKRGKPDPEPYLIGMKKAVATPWECIVIENAPLGVESGARSGALAIGVNTGPIDREQMILAGADVLFDSMPQFASELPSLLECMRTKSDITV